MAKLVTEPPIEDISFLLEVTFIGEEAADYGGAPKEFLGAFVKEVREQLFQGKKTEVKMESTIWRTMLHPWDNTVIMELV